jgi:glycosyltransferase involved in cell wall biosynthesis
MKGKPLVTVITVFLNAQRFLGEAITSVFAQRYDDWELLLVDDGSTDSSTDIAKRYARLYPDKVCYLEHNGHENRGISASQNLGISTARGKYIAFLDSDDIWLPEKLEQQVSILDAHPEAMMVYGQTQYWYSWGGNAENNPGDLMIQPGVEPDSLLRPPLLLIRSLREEIPIPCPSDVMVRRQAATDVGAFEESFRRIFTDQVFYAKLSLSGTVFVSGQNWFKYRKHAGSAVAVVKEQGKLRSARLAYLKWLERYVNDHAIIDPGVHDAIRNAKFRCLLPGLFRLKPHIRYRVLFVKDRLKAFVRRILPVSFYRLLRIQTHNRMRSRVE